MIICINSWISNTQRNRILKNNGILFKRLTTISAIRGDSHHLGLSVPSKKSQAMIPINKFARISPHTIYMYTLRRGDLISRVCLMASHTVNNPKPSVNPAATLASLKSPTFVAMVSEKFLAV
jgi:hypothetical protein